VILRFNDCAGKSAADEASIIIVALMGVIDDDSARFHTSLVYASSAT